MAREVRALSEGKSKDRCCRTRWFSTERQDVCAIITSEPVALLLRYTAFLGGGEGGQVVWSRIDSLTKL